MVKSIDLDKTLVDLDKNIFDDKGYYYVGILTGKYLDDNVEMNRTSFDISESSSEGDISMDDIIAKAKEQVELYLNDYLVEVRDKKNERIRKYISANAPQFGHLLKYMPESINAIKPTLTDAKLDEELYKIKRKFDVELKKENQDILDKIQVGAENLDSYEGKFKEQFEKISEANKAALAEYISHRKIILELLKKGIKLKDDGKFNKESYIHNLIYPMRRTSDEIGYEVHNLWLIDERLAYCEYISSDIPFDNDPKKDRTDILMLDQPVALSDEDNTGREFGTIVILELKRPMRDDYGAGDNPIQQLLGYVDKLSTNRMTDKNGRIIRVGNNTQFYLYAICDLTPKLIKVAYQISQKEEIIREYSYQLQQLQDELKKILQEAPVELHRILLYSEMILSEIDYDNKLKELCEQLEELQANDIKISNSEKEAKQKCKEMKEDIVSRMNTLYREVDPQGRTFFDDIFTKRDETYSGSEEQEYYYSRVLAINDYFNHSYPLLIDCYRSGEISSQKEDIMIKNFISRKKQVIITSTLKKEEYTANKYDQYKGNANVIDYSNNESSKLLQSQYVAKLGTIVESFGVMFTEE